MSILLGMIALKPIKTKMKLLNLLTILVGIVSSQLIFAQDSVNFHVPPSNHSCDSMEFHEEDFEMVMDQINHTTFRFQQNIRVNRKKGFQEASFFSCDNQNGIMLIRYDDFSFLYDNMPKQLWDKLVASGNPGTFFENEIKDKLKAWLCKFGKG